MDLFDRVLDRFDEDAPQCVCADMHGCTYAHNYRQLQGFG